MHGSKTDVPVAMEIKGVKIQEAVWDDIHVSFETYRKRFDVTPLLKGLPDDLDQCPHWGYVLKGEFRTRSKDGREEVVKAGNAYYTAPGHTTIVEAGTELVEFSPKGLLQKTMEVVARNMEAVVPE
ncbi:MAG: hypothetical protein HW414_1572 [Dehalococcoidia bacterium]|nr:hypothetical protein [Dehalococcoidia bacterium]